PRIPNPWYNKLVDMLDSYPKSLQNLWISRHVHSSQLKSTQKPDEPKMNWQFTTADARTKLKRLYPSMDG
ncbi:MAG TPA: hypothetical protein VLI39_09550, partial [Sedimentisphaerales bacterium]|nr:hypothetical protein [Sedimentisphaerales bacterium]